MPNTQEKSRINRVLGNHGLPQMGTPGLMEAFGFLIKDHEHLRSILNACEPAERAACYGALRPHLSFQPHPLDVYIAELGSIAERKQLPTIGEDGILHAFRAPEIGAARAPDPGMDPTLCCVANAAIDEARAKGALELVCRKCTKVETFPGANRAEAIHAARLAGWTYNEVKGDGREICPDCPAARN